ncbi:MAG: Hsp20/alpha crystallin family protein [Nitrososphaerota archaeon]|nr:Hsp20/alpha crystallin family protein [Nitrososphaerota archaeon]
MASDPDSLEDALDEMVKAAQDDLDRIREKKGDDGELLEGADSVSFLLLAPGYSRRDITVAAQADKLVVEAYDFKIARPLGCTVDPSSARTTFVNGVLSVRLAKKP